jgi:hypothetical protein
MYRYDEAGAARPIVRHAVTSRAGGADPEAPARFGASAVPCRRESRGRGPAEREPKEREAEAAR